MVVLPIPEGPIVELARELTEESSCYEDLTKLYTCSSRTRLFIFQKIRLVIFKVLKDNVFVISLLETAFSYSMIKFSPIS